MLGHEPVLIVDRDAGILGKGQGYAVPGVDAGVRRTGYCIYLYWSGGCPDKRGGRSYSMECREKRRKSGPVVRLGVGPAMHAIVKVNDVEVDSFHRGELSQLA